MRDSLSSSSLQHLISASPILAGSPSPLRPTFMHAAPLPKPNWALAISPHRHSRHRSVEELERRNKELSAQLVLAQAHSEHDQRAQDESNVAQFFQHEEST